jgi:hypothetical protein
MAMQPGYKNNQLPDPVKKSEDEVRKEREDLWNNLAEENERSGVNIDQLILKRDC